MVGTVRLWRTAASLLLAIPSILAMAAPGSNSTDLGAYRSGGRGGQRSGGRVGGGYGGGRGDYYGGIGGGGTGTCATHCMTTTKTITYTEVKTIPCSDVSSATVTATATAMATITATVTVSVHFGPPITATVDGSGMVSPGVRWNTTTITTGQFTNHGTAHVTAAVSPAPTTVVSTATVQTVHTVTWVVPVTTRTHVVTVTHTVGHKQVVMTTQTVATRVPVSTGVRTVTTTRVVVTTVTTATASQIAPAHPVTLTTVYGAVATCPAPTNAAPVEPSPPLPSSDLIPDTALTWGCRPGHVCNTTKPAMCTVFTDAPSDDYICDQALCVPAPPLVPIDSWLVPLASGYFDLAPPAFGLSYDVFTAERIAEASDASTWTVTASHWHMKATSTGRHKPNRRDNTIVPSVCFAVCNNAFREAQAVGKTQSLCASDAPFLSYYHGCGICIRKNQPQSSLASNAYLVDRFAQFIDYCHTISATAPSITTPSPQSYVTPKPSRHSASQAPPSPSRPTMPVPLSSSSGRSSKSSIPATSPPPMPTHTAKADSTLSSSSSVSLPSSVSSRSTDTDTDTGTATGTALNTASGTTSPTVSPSLVVFSRAVRPYVWSTRGGIWAAWSAATAAAALLVV